MLSFGLSIALKDCREVDQVFDGRMKDEFESTLYFVGTRAARHVRSKQAGVMASRHLMPCGAILESEMIS
jgi:hypothetical protein